MRLGHKLILGYALLVLLLLALALLAVEVSRRSLQAQISTQSALLATELLDEIDQGLYDRIEETRLYARNFWLRDALARSNEGFEKLPDPNAWIAAVDRAWTTTPGGVLTPLMRELIDNREAEAFRDRMRFYEETYGYRVIGEIFATNRFGANVAQSALTTDYRQDDEPWWQAAMERGYHVGDVTYDESAGIHSIEIAARVEDDQGGSLGVLKVVFNIEEVIDVVRNAQNTDREFPSTMYSLVTREGRVIYTSAGDPVFSRRPDILAAADAAMHGKATMRKDTHGRQLLSAGARSHGHRDFTGLGWVLVLDRPTEEVRAPARQLRNRLWIFGAATIVLAIVAGGAVAASISRRLRRLRRAMEVVASGDLTHRLGTPHRDEIGELSRAFDAMTARLRETTVSRDNLADEVSERRRAEVRLQEALMELERSNSDLEQFAYVASHDLREPLRKVRGFTELLARRYRGRFDERADRQIGYVVDGAARMEQLIEDLLTYSRVGRAEIELAPADMAAVVRGTIEDLERPIAESGAVIEVGPMPTLRVNAEQIRLVFQNLLSNALKFRGEALPRVRVSAERRDGEWLFSVRDNGIGMKAAYFERIFQLFQRLHPRGEYPGTGIGLAVCKKIVERHGGRISVESEPDQGSCFYFTLPVRDEGTSSQEQGA
jgi:signal transduction histidine kinase